MRLGRANVQLSGWRPDNALHAWENEMSMAVWSAVLRPAAIIMLAAFVSGCTASALPSVGSAQDLPSAGPAAASPGVSTPVISHQPTSSPTPAVDAVDAVPTTEGVLNAIWMGDGRVIVGGFAGPIFTATILVFDGTSWSAANVPEAPGQVTGIAKLGDRLIAVGNGLPDIPNGFIWESTNGQTWRTVQTIENAALYDVVSGDGVIVTAGARLDAEMNATATAWASTDGTTWEQAAVADGAGTAIGSVTLSSEGFVATGDRPLGKARPLWAATDATSWVAQANDLNDQLLPTDLVQGTDTLALVGASGKSGDQHPFVALSTDGQHWERTNLSTDEGYASAVAAANDRLVVAGVDADRLTLWAMRAGSWKAVAIEESGASISALAWDSDRGLVAVGARDGRHATWVIEGY
jgi:hypothetical protein